MKYRNRLEENLKLTAKLMKPKSKRNIRVRGWLILICGVLLIALQIVLLVLGQQ